MIMRILKIAAVVYALLMLTWIAWSLNLIAYHAGRTEIYGQGGWSQPLRIETVQ